MKPIRTWILVANGVQATLVEHTGPGHGLADVGIRWTAEPAQAHRDGLGRAFDRKGSSRHRIEPHHAGAQAHEAFARRLAGDLWRLRAENRFDRLIICAPPALLGSLRKQMPTPLKADIMAEISKDLTQVPTAKLPTELAHALAV